MKRSHLSSVLLTQCIILIELQILNHSCIPRINPSWLWCMILITCCSIQFTSILLRVFISMFIRKIIFLFCHVFSFGKCWPHRINLEWYFLFNFWNSLRITGINSLNVRQKLSVKQFSPVIMFLGIVFWLLIQFHC